MSEQERRRLFLAAMRRPEMRLLRGALEWAKWQGHDWRAIQEIEIGQLEGSYWWALLDDWLVRTWNAHKPVLHPDYDFSGYDL